MNVLMPDGTMVTDVPDNITQTELLRRYNAHQGAQAAPAQTTDTAPVDEIANVNNNATGNPADSVSVMEEQAQKINPLPDHPAQPAPALSNNIPVATPFGMGINQPGGAYQRPATWQESAQAIPDQTAGAVKQSVGGAGEMMLDAPDQKPSLASLLSRIASPGSAPNRAVLSNLDHPVTAKDNPLRVAVKRIRDNLKQSSTDLARRGAAQAQAATPPNQTFWQQAFGSGMQSAAQTVPAMGAFALTRNPQFASRFLIGQFGLQEAGRAYDDAKAQGLSNDEAFRHAAISGIAESGTELLPAKALFSRDPNALKRVVNFFAAELPGENLAEVTQLTSEWINGLRDDVTVKDIADTIKMTSAATLFGGGAQVGASHYFNKLGDQIDQHAQNREVAKAFQPINTDFGNADQQAREGMKPTQAQPTQPMQDITAELNQPTPKHLQKKPAPKVDSQNDDLFKAISKLGGLDRTEAQAQGIDPAQFKERAGGSRPVFRKDGGLSFDAMAEALSQHGYFQEGEDIGPNTLLEKLDKQLRGTPVYSRNAADKMLEQQAAERDFEEQQKQALGHYDYDEFAAINDELANELGNDTEVVEQDKNLAAALDKAHDILSESDIETILERAAIQAETDDAYNTTAIQAIHDAIRASQKDQPGREEGQGKAQATAKPKAPDFSLTSTSAPKQTPKKPQATQSDMFGGKTDTQQAIHDRELERKKKQQNAPAISEGNGMLFTDASKQVDVEDKTKPNEPQKLGSASVKAFEPGINHVGGREQEYAPIEKDLPDKPIRREDIIKPFLKALGVPLYQGKAARMKQARRYAGYYQPSTEQVRIKKPMDIETTAHELAHYIDDTIFHGFKNEKGVLPVVKQPNGGTFKRLRLPKAEVPAIDYRPWKKGPMARTYAKELKEVSYDRTKVYEGFAEYVRLWMTQPENAAKLAPQFTEWWNGFVNTHPIGPALKKAREGMVAWYEQGELGKLASKVGYAEEVNNAMADIKDRARQAALDDLHGLYRMERDLTQQIAPAGPYETARLIRSADAILEGALTLGVPTTHRDGSHSFEGKSLMDILKPVSNELDKFFLYSIAKRANRLRGERKERWFSKSEIEAGLKLENPTYLKVHREYQKWNSGMLDFAESKGLIDPVSRALWEKADYIPFHRVDNTPGGNKKGMLGNVSVIKQLKGGEANIRPPLENIILNARMLMKNALQNEARLKIVNLASKVRGGGRYLRKIPKEAGYTSVSKDEIYEYIRDKLSITAEQEEKSPELKNLKEKLSAEFENAPNFIKFLTLGNAPTGKQVFAVMNKGKPVFYEVADPLLWRSLTAFNRPQITNEVVRFMAAVRRIGQTTITLTPDFVAANLARDTLMASIFSRHGFKPFIDSIKGMKSRITKDDNYRLAIANGVGFSSYYTDDTAFRKHLERFYTNKGWDSKTVLDSPSKMFYAIEQFADAFEMSARLGEFQRARDAGDNPRHAAYLGREVSTDFSMRGDNATLNFLYDTVMFLKAGVNGLDRAYRGFAHDPNRGAIATKTALLAMMSAMLYLINRDNPLYEEAEDWEKDTYWHFLIPTKAYYDYYQQHGEKPQPKTPEEAAQYFNHFRYPKIWEIGAVSSVAERTFEQLANLADDQRDASAGKLATDSIRIMGDLFKLNIQPQVAGPIFEQLANENFFTKRPIETKGMEDLPTWMRAKQNTSETLKYLAEKTRDLPSGYQLPPARAEALLRGYFNTWAMYGLTISDAIFFDKSIDPNHYPVLRRFYKNHPSRYNKYTTEFYDLLKEATELRRGFNALDKSGQFALAEEYAEKQREDEYYDLTRLNSDIGDIHKEMRQIANDPELSESKKAKLIEKLQIEKNTAMRELVESIKKERRENAISTR